MSKELAALGVGGAGAAGGPTVLVLDQFTDADGTDLAAHAIAPTNTPGTAWTEVFNTLQVLGNQAADADGGGLFCAAVCDAGQADVTVQALLTFGITDGAANQVNLYARYTDNSNYWLMQHDPTTVQLYEITGGSSLSRASSSNAADLAQHTYKLVLSGPAVTGYLDGTPVWSYGSATSNQTATKHGVRLRSDSTTVRAKCDNFQVTTP